MAEPFISIVLPTRDRPELVGLVLKFLKTQSFENFEVIVSDNGINRLCYQEVLPYLKDERFKYKRPPHPMAMSDHWEFAIEGAQGEYISIFCEKYILRKDALAVVHATAKQTNADVINWQRDDFHTIQNKGARLAGYYHPLVKPQNPIVYMAEEELRKSFAFDFPSFSRRNRSFEPYGKIYVGCIKKQLINQVIRKYGKFFHSIIPDFSSKFAALNEKPHCVDVGQSLVMRIIMDSESNGIAVSRSIPFLENYIKSYGIELDAFKKTLPIPDVCIGQVNFIAYDLLLIKELAEGGTIKDLELDVQAVAFWANLELELINDWHEQSKAYYQSLLAPYLKDRTGKSLERLQNLEHNFSIMNTPNGNEIYHSGLEKTDIFIPGTSASRLAEIHWKEGLAPPRKNVTTRDITLEDAAVYFYEYNQSACEILGIE